VRGKWLIVYIDDASRLVTGWGLFDEPTAENTISVLDRAIREYGKPVAILTDHGSQFYSNYGDVKSPGITLFQEYLSKHKIRHVLGRIQHLQPTVRLRGSSGLCRSSFTCLGR